MGQLDERGFAHHLQACRGCGGTSFDVATYLDRHVEVMLGDANDDGKWVHDGEKFVDGVYRIACATCGVEAFASDACPRCHAPGALPATLAAPSHLAVPKRCPACSGMQLALIGFAPATVRTTGAKPPTPTPRALFGEPGFHVIAMACDDCDWARTAPSGPSARPTPRPAPPAAPPRPITVCTDSPLC